MPDNITQPNAPTEVVEQPNDNSPSLGAKTPQARWAQTQQAKGNCRICGQPRPPELKQHCRACQDKVTAYMKRYRFNHKHNTAQTVAETTTVEIKGESNAQTDQRTDATSV